MKDNKKKKKLLCENDEKRTSERYNFNSLDDQFVNSKNIIHLQIFTFIFTMELKLRLLKKSEPIFFFHLFIEIYNFA